MRRIAKMMAEGILEPCEKGTNDPEVQRSLSILLYVSSLNMPTFKVSKNLKGWFYPERFIKRWAIWWSIKLVCENLPKIIMLT